MSSSSQNIVARPRHTSFVQRRLRRLLPKKLFRTKRVRQRLFRYSIVTLNMLILSGVAIFAVTTSQSDLKQTSLSAPLVASEAISSPLDTLSSNDVAVQVARTIGLAEATAVTNQSDSIKINAVIAQADTAVVAKPQIIGESQHSGADIAKYVTVAGDTISGIARKFGVTSDSIRWSNSISGEMIRVGTELTIPPVNGVVYTVARGDTAVSIAQRYQVSAPQIIAFNDAELTGLRSGQKIVIPGGRQPAAAAAVATNFNFSARYGYNGYDYGWCTWYVASKVNVPTNWGNANTWDNRARMTSGWRVNSTPKVGAIGQTDRGGLGHVVYIEAVSADGKQVKYSDMNGVAGWNRVGHSGWVDTGRFVYIYR